MTNLERAYEKLNAEANRPAMGQDILIVGLSRAEVEALRQAALTIFKATARFPDRTSDER